jgi:hypothetical protein
VKYIRTKYGEVFDLKTTSKHLFVVRDKTKEGKNCYVSWLWDNWENYFLIDEQNCTLFSYNSAQSFTSDLMLKNLNYNNLVIELHPSFKEYKQSDDLKELCDEFRGIWKNYYESEQKDAHEEYYYNKEKNVFYDDFEELTHKEAIEKFDMFYGAIWTDRGLIYVAKMNDDGELELL